MVLLLILGLSTATGSNIASDEQAQANPIRKVVNMLQAFFEVVMEAFCATTSVVEVLWSGVRWFGQCLKQLVVGLRNFQSTSKFARSGLNLLEVV